METEQVTIERANVLVKKFNIKTPMQSYTKSIAFREGEFYIHLKNANNRYEAEEHLRAVPENHVLGVGIVDNGAEDTTIVDEKSAAIWVKSPLTPRRITKRILEGWKYE